MFHYKGHGVFAIVILWIFFSAKGIKFLNLKLLRGEKKGKLKEVKIKRNSSFSGIFLSFFVFFFTRIILYLDVIGPNTVLISRPYITLILSTLSSISESQ